MPSDKKRITIYLTQSEKTEIEDLAGQANISACELVKRCSLGRKLPNAHRHQDILALVKINADLARLGNLLKMLMDDDEILNAYQIRENELNDLIVEIRGSQGFIHGHLKQLKQ